MCEFSEFREFVSKLQTVKEPVKRVKTIPAVFGIETKEVYITKWIAYMLSVNIIGADILNAFLCAVRTKQSDTMTL